MITPEIIGTRSLTALGHFKLGEKMYLFMFALCLFSHAEMVVDNNGYIVQQDGNKIHVD